MDVRLVFFFFFFFKQKTAYEMRISDWSSDVCSSDLFVVSSVQTQLLDTFDIAQVEVLRGPQGTLFGKNTTGGAVTVRTKRPDLDNIGVEARAMYGSFNTTRLQGAANIPIIPGKRSEEQTSEHQSLMRNSYAVFG